MRSLFPLEAETHIRRAFISRGMGNRAIHAGVIRIWIVLVDGPERSVKAAVPA